MAQLINITSEALQATIRRLLPSQQGFGEDLQATNVITPVIDITATAEGSQLPTDLARAMSFTSQTGFKAAGSTVTISNTPGFYTINGTVTLRTSTSTLYSARLQMSDGSTTKNVWEMETVANTSDRVLSETFYFTVYLDTGDTVSAVSSSADVIFAGSSRQVADKYGNVINPGGFTFE